MIEEKEPTVTSAQMGHCDPHEEYNHDAYATITLTTMQGGAGALFGSDLGHDQRVHISIQRAKLHRNLNRDWIHGQNMPMVDFEMSHAQFAQFITSNGSGSGTPVTLRMAPPRGSLVERMPLLKNIETKHETFRREIADASRKRLDSIRSGVDSLGAMVASGKVSMKDLRSILSNLSRHVDQLPGTMEFVVKSAEEALEKATHDAKIEVEAYISATAQRLGLESISQLAQLDKQKATTVINIEKAECNHVYSRAINQPYPRKCMHCGETEPLRKDQETKL